MSSGISAQIGGAALGAPEIRHPRKKPRCCADKGGWVGGSGLFACIASSRSWLSKNRSASSTNANLGSSQSPSSQRRTPTNPACSSSIFSDEKSYIHKCALFPKQLLSRSMKPLGVPLLPSEHACMKVSAAVGSSTVAERMYCAARHCRSGTTRRNSPPGRSIRKVFRSADSMVLRGKCSNTWLQKTAAAH